MRRSFFSIAFGALIASSPGLASAQPEEVFGVVLDAEYPAPPVDAELPAPPVEDLSSPDALAEPQPAEWGEPEAPALDSLRAEVSPYGQWLEVPGLGVVWKPYARVVGPGFQPYVSNGRWIEADAGWVFESDWPWGRVVFHYGRWHLAANLGWVWIPGNEWAPSWCDDRVAVHLSPAPHRRYWSGAHRRMAYRAARPAAWRYHPARAMHQPRRHYAPRAHQRRFAPAPRQPRRHFAPAPRVHQPRRFAPAQRQPRRHFAPRVDQPRRHFAPRVDQPRRHFAPAPRRHRAPSFNPGTPRQDRRAPPTHASRPSHRRRG